MARVFIVGGGQLSRALREFYGNLSYPHKCYDDHLGNELHVASLVQQIEQFQPSIIFFCAGVSSTSSQYREKSRLISVEIAETLLTSINRILQGCKVISFGSGLQLSSTNTFSVVSELDKTSPDSYYVLHRNYLRELSRFLDTCKRNDFKFIYLNNFDDPKSPRNNVISIIRDAFNQSSLKSTTEIQVNVVNPDATREWVLVGEIVERLNVLIEGWENYGRRDILISSGVGCKIVDFCQLLGEKFSIHINLEKSCEGSMAGHGRNFLVGRSVFQDEFDQKIQCDIGYENYMNAFFGHRF